MVPWPDAFSRLTHGNEMIERYAIRVSGTYAHAPFPTRPLKGGPNLATHLARLEVIFVSELKRLVPTGALDQSPL